MTSLAAFATEPGDKNLLIRRALEQVCHSFDWAFGQFWSADLKGEVLHCSDYYFSTVPLPDFRRESLERKFSKGVGLPGRVWSTAFPEKLSNLTLEDDFTFRRKDAATKNGLIGAYAFPIKSGPFIFGILEFLDFKQITLDHEDDSFFDKLGVYLGNLISNKEIEHSAQNESLFNRIVLDNSSHAFIAIDQTSAITHWNLETTKLFGWTKEEVLGKQLAEIIIPPKYREAHMKGFLKFLATNSGPVFNKIVNASALTKSGDEIKINMKIFPINVFDLKCAGAFIFKADLEQDKPDITLQ